MSANVLVTYGGGLVDPSKHVLMRLAHNLSNSQCFDTVYIGQYSFESLYTPEFLKEYNPELVEEVKSKRGTFFGTCRGIYLTDPILFNKAILCLKERSITTIVVAGGDGSSRQVAEISDKLRENDINIIFALPLTIDGINGGESIGKVQAVRESVRQVENIVSTSLKTRDEEKFGVVIVELQGRNRDDIMADVLLGFLKKKKVSDIELSDLLLRVVPANIETDYFKLIEEVNSSDKQTLILLSEGAKIKLPHLYQQINRKVRSLIVGHASQSNNMTTRTDLKQYNAWIDKVCSHIAENPNNSYSLVKYQNSIWEAPIDYYAVNNPKVNQIPEIDAFSNYWLKMYMAK